MFDTLKKKLYFARTKLLLMDGIAKGEILPFENDLYDRLNHIYFSGVPLSIHLKYLKPLPVQPGKCYDRSLWLTMAFSDAILVRADNKNLELKYGRENAGHGWIERNGWVYDPTTQYKYKKELYYRLYEPINIECYKPEEYTQNIWYQDIVNTTLSDLKQGGKKRYELLMPIPLIKKIAEMSSNQEFISQLNTHLEIIGYDYDEINNELDNEIFNINSNMKR